LGVKEALENLCFGLSKRDPYGLLCSVFKALNTYSIEKECF
jgi:hypothetical protein